MKNMVWRLLRHNISAGQLTGYALANFVGLTIVLTALQFYRDVTTVWDDDDSFMTRDYTVVSHKVTGLGSLTGSSEGFSESDISDLQSQPWVRRVGAFTASAYNVSASVDMGGRGMSTALFFESIPDEFFDSLPADWTFDPANPVIPVILSKDYLSLYNFGFASSRGLPQLSEAMIGMVPLRVSVSGNGRQQWFPARIVGFSSRLNTIAVPEQFMEWANARFGEEPVADPSRLIVELSRPGDPAIKEYMAAHDYEMSGDNTDSGKASYFLTVVTGVVVAVGGVISLLSFFILMLSIFLLLQKNRDKLHDLMLLGYSPAAVSRYYATIVVAINAGVLVLAIIAMLVGRAMWQPPLSRLGIEASSPWMAILTGVVIIALITTVNLTAIRRAMRRYF